MGRNPLNAPFTLDSLDLEGGLAARHSVSTVDGGSLEHGWLSSMLPVSYHPRPLFGTMKEAGASERGSLRPWLSWKLALAGYLFLAHLLWMWWWVSRL